MALRLLQNYSSASETESDDERNEELIKITKSEHCPMVKPARNVNKRQPFKLSNDVNANESSAATTSKQESPTEQNANEDMVVKNNFINSNMHGASGAEPSFDESHFDKCIDEINRITKSNLPRQLIKTDGVESGQENSALESDSNSDSDWESFSNSEDEIVNNSNAAKSFNKNSKPFLKVKGELGLEDLPPIEDLKISVSHQQCEAIGSIYNIVDKLVIVHSLPNKPSLDLDTVLFLDNGSKVLGQVFDVFGQVTEPFYLIRFNSNKHIKEAGVVTGMPVYYAPQTDHTNFIVVSELMRLKGSDASWQHDLEIPPEFADYSDDEQERMAKREHQRKKMQTDADTSNTSQKRHKLTEFEQKMNKKNLQKTAEWSKTQNTSKKPWDRHRAYNPFSCQTVFKPASDMVADSRWTAAAASGHTRFGTPTQPNRNPKSNNWEWKMQNQFMPMPPPATATFCNTPPISPICNIQAMPPICNTPPMASFCNTPPFMRPPRFSVPPYDWPLSSMTRPVPPPPPSGDMSHVASPSGNMVTHCPPPAYRAITIQRERFPVNSFGYHVPNIPSPIGPPSLCPIPPNHPQRVAATSTTYMFTGPPPAIPPPSVVLPHNPQQPMNPSNPSTSSWPMYSFPAPPGT